MNGTKRPLPDQYDEADDRVQLNPEQVRRLRQRYNAGGISVKKLAETYGISVTHCDSILKHRVKG